MLESACMSKRGQEWIEEDQDVRIAKAEGGGSETEVTQSRGDTAEGKG